MTETYFPQPGTIDARAIAHLRTLPTGAMLAAGVLADTLDVDRDDLVPALERAWRAGAVAREAQSGNVRWGIGHPKLRTLAGPLPVTADDDEPDDFPLIQRTVAAPGRQETAVTKPADAPPQPKPKKAWSPAPTFDPLAIELKVDRPIPPKVRGPGAVSPYKVLLDRMQPGQSVDLPKAAAKSLMGVAKKAGVKIECRQLDDATTGVWRL